MAVTGLILIAFLVMHMAGNLKLFISYQEFNEYSHFLRDGMLVPIFPPMVFLWCFRVVLLLCIVLHIYAAVTLWHKAAKSTGGGRYANAKFLNGPYVPFFMRWGGITIFIFVIAHILQFTSQIITVGYSGDTDPAHRMLLAFNASHWYVYVLYFIAMAAVCFHVAHGFWSAFATLGANVSKGAEKVLRVLAIICAAALFLGFMATPTAILVGGLK